MSSSSAVFEPEICLPERADTPVRLLATDLDGTLVGRSNQVHLYPRFREQIMALREKYGCKWAICTGRSLKSYKTIMQPLRLLGLSPDYVVARHAYIYSSKKYCYEPHVIWNLATIINVTRKKMQTSSMIDRIYDLLSGLGNSSSPVCLYRHDERLVMRFPDEDGAKHAHKLVADELQEHQYLCVFRYSRDLDVRLVPFTKGLAIKELASHIGCQPEETMVIGNGHNDISMMRKEVSQYYGCPLNSDAEVVELVHQLGGHVAKSSAMEGVVEVMNAYSRGKPDSSLPPGWDPPHNQVVKLSHHISSRRHKADVRRRIALLTGVGMVVLLVLANYGVIPFSWLIMRPFYMLINLLWRGVMFLN